MRKVWKMIEKNIELYKKLNAVTISEKEKEELFTISKILTDPEKTISYTVKHSVFDLDINISILLSLIFSIISFIYSIIYSLK